MNSSVGCTQVFNKSLLASALKISISYKVLHDWWIFVICKALLGDIYYEKTPLIYYRQHGHNVLGGQSCSKIQKLKNWIFHKNEHLNSSLAKKILEGFEEDITKLPSGYKNIKLLRLAAYSSDSWGKRIKLLANASKFKTCNPDVNYGFLLSALFGKF